MKESVTCPMCPEQFEARNDVRVHIMCDHRKSAVTDELLTVLESKHELSRVLRERNAERRPVAVLKP